MQIPNASPPLQLRFDPVAPRTHVLSPEQQAKRTLGALASEQLFKDNQRALSGRSSVDTAQRSREPLYQRLETDLSNLRTRLGEFAISNGTGTFQASGPSSVTGAARLNLGEGRQVQSIGTTTYQPPAVEATLDPTAKLATQPFTNPISTGTLKVTFRVNGGGATTKSVAINPNTDSLDSVLTKLNNLTVAGGVKPLTATYDAVNGEIDFRVNSTKGANFDFTFGTDTSGFLAAIGADGVATSETATAVRPIANHASRTKYFKLNITVEGQAPIAFNNLQVSSASLTRDQKVDELVTQINAGLGATGLLAQNAGGGKIGFTSSDPDAPLRPDLGLRITQASRTGAVSLGFQTSGGGGFVTGLDLSLDPALTTVAPPPVTTTQTINTTVGGALGSDATLGDLAGQLGLQGINGQYALEVNGQTLTFSEDQSLDEVLAGFAAAGARATYDPNSQRITVENTGGGPLTIADRSGNLATQLGVVAGAAGDNNARLALELEEFVGAVDEITDLLDTITARDGAQTNDPLLQDLRAALGGLLGGPSGGGELASLADLGITRVNGELRIDDAQLARVATERTDELNRFLGTFFGERANPLIQAGVQALQTAGEVAPIESRAAMQAVRVRGELARLQSRQQMLALERLNYEGLRDRLERQDEELARTAREIERRVPSGRPEEVEDAARLAKELGAGQNPALPPRILAPATAGPPPAPGLTSFGLSHGTA